MTISDRIRGYIVEELSFSVGPEVLTDDYPLIDNEVLDSLGLFQLVAFIENDFDLEVLDDELVLENFGTIGDIARLIGSKRAA